MSATVTEPDWLSFRIGACGHYSQVGLPCATCPGAPYASGYAYWTVETPRLRQQFFVPFDQVGAARLLMDRLVAEGFVWEGEPTSNYPVARRVTLGAR